MPVLIATKTDRIVRYEGLLAYQMLEPDGGGGERWADHDWRCKLLPCP